MTTETTAQDADLGVFSMFSEMFAICNEIESTELGRDGLLGASGDSRDGCLGQNSAPHTIASPHLETGIAARA